MPVGDTPYILRGGQTDYKRLFYSNPNQAFMKTIHIPAGYGVLAAGTMMGRITESTSRLGQYVPYVTEGVVAGVSYPGFTPLVTEGAADTLAYIVKEDAYKFAVGDHGGAVDSDGSPVDLGALVSIDVTTYPHMALLTWTNNVTTGIEVAKNGGIFIQTNTASPYTKAVGFLFGAVDTGTGENAKGADASLVIGNAMVYKAMLTGYDAHSLADLTTGREDGQYFIF
jgi:hypothetical protein